MPKWVYIYLEKSQFKMLVTFLSIFVVDTKIIYYCDFVAPFKLFILFPEKDFLEPIHLLIVAIASPNVRKCLFMKIRNSKVLIIFLVKYKKTDSCSTNHSMKAKININLIWYIPCLLAYFIHLLTSCTLSIVISSSSSDFFAHNPLTMYPVNW